MTDFARSAVPVLASALIVVALALGACGDSKKEVAKAPPPPQVGVLAARAETVPVVREYVGNVQAFSSVEITARVEGILEQRHFTEGTDVRKGQLLYSIDPSQYEQSLRSAQAALANARAAQANAQAALANAQAREQRLGPLVKEEAISKQDYDDAVAQEKSALAQVDSARAQADSAQASVESAKLNLGYTKVLATESGRVGQTLVPEGRLVGRGQPTHLVTIERIDPIYVTFTTPDRDAIVLRRAVEKGTIRAGEGANTARFVLPDGSELTGVGRLDFTDAQVNKETGTITQRAIIDNPKRQLLPGMFVNVVLRVGERPNAVLIPQKAVVKMPNGHVAWVVGPDDKVERRDLVVGEWYRDEWIVEKGLAAGERVIVEGVQRAQPGLVVAPVNAGAAKPAPGAAPATPAVPAKTK